MRAKTRIKVKCMISSMLYWFDLKFSVPSKEKDREFSNKISIVWFYFFLASLLVVCSPSHSAGHQPVSSSCDPEYFESEDCVEALLSLEEFVEILADLKIHSTADFISLKRDGAIPDGITGRPLQIYPDLKGEWSHLWDRVHDIRVIRGENPEERRRGRKGPSVKELENFIQGMVNELDEHGLAGEDIPEEEFPEKIGDDIRSQNGRGKKIRSVRSDRGRDRTKGKKSGSTETPAGLSSGTSQRTAEPSHRDFQEEKKKKLLELIAENNRITIAEMATEMSLSRPTIDRMIAGLKQEGRLTRIGGKKTGYWQILQEGDQPDDLQKEMREKLLGLIAENNRITGFEMAEEMGLSRTTIYKIIAGLKQDGRLTRIGGDVGGYWQILQEGDQPDDLQKERREKLLGLISENRRITIAEMATEMSLSRATINKMIAGLKREGCLAKVGSTAYGYWQVLQEGDQPDDPQKEREEKLLGLIVENAGITIAEMATKMSLSRPTIERMLAGLKQEGRLTRIGGKKSGYWQILQEGDQPDDLQKERKNSS